MTFFDVYGINPAADVFRRDDAPAENRRVVDRLATLQWRGLAAAAWRAYTATKHRGALVVQVSELLRGGDYFHSSYRPATAEGLSDLPDVEKGILADALQAYRPDAEVLVEFVLDAPGGRLIRVFRLASHDPAPPAAARADRN